MNTYLLPVPYDVSRLINEFAYYDRTSWKYIQQDRMFKGNLCFRMIHCYITPQHTKLNDTFAMWLALPPYDISIERQFQAVFCLKCGDYLSGNRLFCRC